MRHYLLIDVSQCQSSHILLPTSKYDGHIRVYYLVYSKEIKSQNIKRQIQFFFIIFLATALKLFVYTISLGQSTRIIIKYFDIYIIIEISVYFSSGWYSTNSPQNISYCRHFYCLFMNVFYQHSFVRLLYYRSIWFRLGIHWFLLGIVAWIFMQQLLLKQSNQCIVFCAGDGVLMFFFVIICIVLLLSLRTCI